MKIRTLQKAVEEIKKQDSGTNITYSALLKLCKEDKLKHIKSGNRFLINLEDLEQLWGE